MRLVISIRPLDFIFDAHKASLRRRLETCKGAATRKKNESQTSAHPTLEVAFILAEVCSVATAEIRRMGIFGWVDELQTPGLAELEPHRAVIIITS